jgi:hypothetical protein
MGDLRIEQLPRCEEPADLEDLFAEERRVVDQIAVPADFLEEVAENGVWSERDVAGKAPEAPQGGDELALRDVGAACVAEQLVDPVLGEGPAAAWAAPAPFVEQLEEVEALPAARAVGFDG